MKELTYFREISGGTPNTSINRHSVRVYEHETGVYILDRTIDANPPFFTLYKKYPTENPFLGKLVLVNGQAYWGDGITWKTAEKMMEETINNL